MPELITKYPDVALSVLKSGNIKCGVGEPQKILVTCPKENFCALPDGELCIYDIKNTFSSTQIHLLDLFQIPNIIAPLCGLFLIIFIVGIVTGIKLIKREKR
jgi:hypothetical protein